MCQLKKIKYYSFPHFLLLLYLGVFAFFLFLLKEILKKKPDGGFSSTMAGTKNDMFWWLPSNQCGQVLVKPIWGTQSLPELISWEMEHIFIASSKFLMKYRKEIFRQLPVLLLLLGAWYY